MPRVILIGLDGATFDVIRPLVDSGRLPAFARIMREGAWGTLRSSYPAITPPAFASMLTGCNPGKHGVYDFFSRRPDSYEFAPSSGGMMRAEPLHRILDRQGLSAGMMNVPMTYPPTPLEHGYVVSGLETPPGARYTSPAALQAELGSAVAYRIELDRWYRFGEEAGELAAILDLAEKHRRAALHLLSRHPTDFFGMVLRAPDQAQHNFWRFYDAAHPGYTAAGHAKFGDYIPRAYEACDRAIADIRLAAPDATIIIASDHGFGRETKLVHLNNWLLREGYVRFKSGPLGRLKQMSFGLGLTADNVVQALSRLHLERLFTGVSRETKAGVFKRLFLSYDDIDWAQTRAYARGQIGQIFLNVRGREPAGIVPSGGKERLLRDEIIAKLMDLRDPETGERIVERCHVREELYSGPMAAAAPDIVIDWKGMEYWTFDVLTGGRKIIGPNLETRSGGHQQHGIVMAHGAGIAAREIDGADITDVAPTLLHMLGLAVPEAMDGRVLREMFTMAPADIARETSGARNGAPEAEAYTPEEEAAVKERLRQLGYL